METLEAPLPARPATLRDFADLPGPRVCPERYLAMLEIKMAMAVLLGQFDIASVETPDGGDARETMAFTMYPDGLTMRLRPR